MDVPSVTLTDPRQDNKPLWRRVLLGLFILLIPLVLITGYIFIWTADDAICDYPPDIAARAQIMTFSSAVKMYQLRNRALPATLDSLVMPPANTAGKKTFIVASGIVDPWGRQFIYKSPGKDGKPYDIYSAGPDGVDGTDDDIHPN